MGLLARYASMHYSSGIPTLALHNRKGIGMRARRVQLAKTMELEAAKRM